MNGIDHAHGIFALPELSMVKLLHLFVKHYCIDCSHEQQRFRFPIGQKICCVYEGLIIQSCNPAPLLLFLRFMKHFNINTILCLVICLIASCNNESPGKHEDHVNDSTTITNPGKTNPPEEDASPSFGNVELNGNTTSIKFPEFTISIESLVFNKGKTENRQRDTVRIYLEPGESIEGKRIRVTSGQSDLELDQQYETSVTISNEGPHCDLKEWKHFYSGWKSLARNKNEFTAPRYSLDERKKFPDVSMNELKEKVRSQCGDEWYQLINNINSPIEYPASVSISRYFLKISSDGRGERDRIIVFEAAMGG